MTKQHQLASTPLQNLYRSLLRQANNFPQEFYKKYAVRRIKDQFSEIKNVKEPALLDSFLSEQKQALEQMKRMAKVQQIFFDTVTGSNPLYASKVKGTLESMVPEKETLERSDN